MNHPYFLYVTVSLLLTACQTESEQYTEVDNEFLIEYEFESAPGPCETTEFMCIDWEKEAIGRSYHEKKDNPE